MDHTIQNEFLTVSAATHGAELQSIRGADGIEYLWQGDPAYWADRAINIFPFVARLEGGRFTWGGETYEMRIHGIACYSDFQVIENTGTRLAMELVSGPETLKSYPCRFAFRVIYELEGRTLMITYEAENRDEKTMYFGLGGHPGFNVPIRRDLRFEDYRLRFTSPRPARRVGFNDDCFVTGQLLPYALEGGAVLELRHDLFDNDAIVLEGTCREVTVETPLDSRSVTVSFPQIPYLGLWHKPKSDAPYVCIEPWCTLPGNAGELTALDKRPDLLHIEPEKIYRTTWKITVNT